MKEEYLNFDFNDFVKMGEREDGSIIDSTTLGLEVAKQLITMMDGNMDFKNEVGKGTKYFIYFSQNRFHEYLPYLCGILIGIYFIKVVTHKLTDMIYDPFGSELRVSGGSCSICKRCHLTV